MAMKMQASNVALRWKKSFHKGKKKLQEWLEVLSYLPKLLSILVSSMETRPRSPWSAVTIDTSSQQPYKSSTANRLAGMACAIGPKSSPFISRCNLLFLSIKTPRVSPSWRLSRLRRKLSFTYENENVKSAKITRKSKGLFSFSSPNQSMISYLVPVNIHCVINNYPRADLDAVRRAWKAGKGVWVLGCNADHNRASPAAI